VTGDGVARPRGFTTYPNGTSTGQIEQITSATTDVISHDDVYNLIYSIKSPYLANARFMAARLTIRDFRLLRDESGGAGLGMWMWQPNFQVGQPQMLGGYPIHQADDMAAVAADALPVAFGDFRAAYTIVDRMGVRTLRDPYTAKPNVKFYTTRRVGGDVVNFEAIKLLITT
jgi:HK97 family phage major capsid protein